MSNQLKIGLALSGGGARGVAHIGVLHGLNELGIYPSHVSGSSAGALVGALYCFGMKPHEIFELSKEKYFSKIFHIGFTSLGLTDHRYLEVLLQEQLGDIDLRELKTPLSVGVTNINKGQFEIMESGRLIPAIKASCSVPLLFKPVMIDKELYVDGGLMNNLPVEPLLDHCDRIIGVSVHQHSYKEQVTGVRDIGIRSFQLAIWNTMAERLKKCDIALDVTAAAEIGMFELDRAEELFEIGKEAVRKREDEFKALLHNNRIYSNILR